MTEWKLSSLIKTSSELGGKSIRSACQVRHAFPLLMMFLPIAAEVQQPASKLVNEELRSCTSCLNRVRSLALPSLEVRSSKNNGL